MIDRIPRFIRFGMVGCVGYVVDASILWLLLSHTGPIVGRLISFLCAATTTFALNRAFTFPSTRRDNLLKQYVKFLGANAVGGAVNVVSSWLLMGSHQPIISSPFFAVFVGAVLGFGINYALSHKFVFAAENEPQAGGNVAPMSNRLLALAAPLTALFGFALSVAVYWPGIFTPDSMDQFDQAQSGEFGDWHPPAMAALWFVFNRLHVGPELLFLFHLALFWAGLWAVSSGLTRSGVKFGGLFPLLGLAPFVFNFVGLLWKDVAIADAWLLAAGLVFRRRVRGEHFSWIEHALIWLAFLYGGLVRANSIFAAAPLALYLVDLPNLGDVFSRKLWPQLAAIVLAPALLLASSMALNAGLNAEKEYAASSLFLFDLAAISHREHANVLPGRWTAAQAAHIPDCFGQDRWDHTGMGDCQFVTETLADQKLLGSPALSHAWLFAIVAHPSDYIAHRLAFTNSILRWLGPVPVQDAFMESEITDPRYAHHPGPIFRAYESACEALTSTPLFRPYFWLVLGFAGLALSFTAQPSPQRAFAGALSASGIVYLLTYIVFGVASDFRYAYWSIVATMASGAALFGCAWASGKQFRITLGASAALLALTMLASVAGG